MKTALVLGGGGSKGAYEVGVWKALRECGISFDLVCGTSIGALIGTMVVQDQYEECYRLWDHLRVEDIIVNGVNLDFDMDLLMSQKDKYKTILQSYVTHKGADITPFEHMVDTLFDAKRFFQSPMDFACMSVNVTKMAPHAFTKAEMRKDVNPCDALLASAACFPAFPMRKIKQDRYIDGGYYDNVPIELARSLGAKCIIAVDLKSVGTKKLWKPQSDVLYMEPYVTLGSFLYFDEKRIHRNMRLGYLDAMKKLKRYFGYIYTFPLHDQSLIDQFELRFEQYSSTASIVVKYKKINALYQTLLTHQLLSSVQEYADYDHPYMRMLELCAFFFEVNDEAIYSFPAFLADLSDRIQHYTPSYGRFDEKKTARQIVEFMKGFAARDCIYYAYDKLCRQEEDTIRLLRLLAVAKPDDFLMAQMLVYIHSDAWRRCMAQQ